MDDKLKHLKKSMENTVFEEVPFNRENSIRAVLSAKEQTPSKGDYLKKGLLSGVSITICVGLIFFTIFSISNQNSNPQQPHSQTAHTPDVKGILNNASQSDKNLRSFHGNFNYTMNIESGEDKTKYIVDGKMDISSEPSAAHVIMNTSTGTTPTASTEMYMTDTTTYSSSSENPNWFKENSSLDNIKSQTKNYDPFNNLPLFEKHPGDVTKRITDNTYVLSIEIKQGNFIEIMKNYFDLDLSDDMMTLFKQMTFENLTGTYVFDKESYLPKNTKMIANASMVNDSGETASISISFSIDYSQINEVNNIKIPQNIINNAVKK